MPRGVYPRKKSHSRVMKEVWMKRKAAKKVAVTTKPEPKPQMKVRVIYHPPDGTTQIDNFEVDKDCFGVLVDMLHLNYLGIPISEVLIQLP